MDLSDIVNEVVTFCRANPIIAIAGGILLLFLIYKKPKFFLSIFLIAALLAGTVYIILNAASSGVSEKEKLLNKAKITDTERNNNQNR